MPILVRRGCVALSMMLGLSAGGCSILVGDSLEHLCDAAPAEWQVVLDGSQLDRAALAVWGASPTDVYVVGGPVGNSGFESLALHFDGHAWRDLRPGGTETFWRVAGTNDDDIWMVGERGRITHYDGLDFEEYESGTTATLWGVWASSTSEAWAVGGTPEGGPDDPTDVVLRWDGATWTEEPLPGPKLGVALLKVWGTNGDHETDNVYVVGERGTIWHRTNGAWKLESDPPLAGGTLVTVSGCSASEVYAVGGNDLLRSDGRTWVKTDIALSSAAAGVSCQVKKGASRAENELVVVGSGGLKQRFLGGQWVEETDEAPHADLHSSWSDGEGAYWAAGGGFLSFPAPNAPREGIVARNGCGRVSSDFE